jgi:anti-sigma B factor antagonist
MRIWQTRHEDAIVLHLHGHLGVGEGVRALRGAVDRALSEDTHGLVLNLSGVAYLDAAGVGELVLCHQKALSRGRRVVVIGIHGRVQEVLGLTKLASRLEQGADEQQAVNRLRAVSRRWRSSPQPQTAGHPA